ncbi:hypothetical protein DVA67_010415 [Solirubrobacter sp. CPCC 204708]|uniref:Tetratricopeptide repeat protein n=1 Tax=Solirubrobacter deserti TaxID=2282478 RepID=A0ABT4RSG6_9ACTN|nr:hypothetical protein [Solirubrobacter deserti]MBE2316391.1 hypothetical protein [Solirubrobacter deserti]MDA0141529.1 hypothetical protein [Solirubrobacter deserti]
MVARVLLVVAALVAGTWLVVQARAGRAEERLIELAFEAPEPPPQAESERLLTQARRWNPDRRPELFEGVILARQGRTREAIATLQAVTRAEPANLEAWGLLRSAAADTDPAIAQQAAARARALSPLGR